MTINSTHDLPEWEDIVAAKPGDGSGLDGLDMLIEAIMPQPNASSAFTKKDLKKRLNCLFPENAPFSDETVDDLLQRAIMHNIVSSSVGELFLN